MNCPQCEHELKLVKRLVSESEDRIKTYTYQWWKCKKCKQTWFGELTEFVFDDSDEHALYEAPKDIWDADINLVKKCPNYKNTACSCLAHSGDLFSHYEKQVKHSY